MRIAFSASRRRFWVAVGGGLSGLALVGAARLYSRHQQLLRPGPLPEESEGVGPLDALIISAQLGGSTLPWDPRAITRWVREKAVMNRRHFLAHSAAGLSLLGGFSSYAQANLDKARILVIGGGVPALLHEPARLEGERIRTDLEAVQSLDA